MSFNFGGRQLPMGVRIARSLLFAQATLLVMGGLFLGVIAGLLRNSVAIASVTITGASAIALAVVYVGAAVVVYFTGWELGHLSVWGRLVATGLELVLAIAYILEGDGEIVWMVVKVVVCVAATGLLWIGPAAQAFKASASAPQVGPLPGESLEQPGAPPV